MKCSEVNEIMMKYFDGEINDIDFYYFKQHLKSCPACSEQYTIMSEVLGYMEKQPSMDPPEDFEACVMESIKVLPVSRKSFIRMPLSILYVLLATAFLMFTIWAVIFLNSITAIDLIQLIMRNGLTLDLLDNILVAAENSYKTVIIVGNSIFDIYYVVLRNYYDVMLSMTAVIVIGYIMSTRMIKQN